jgi:phosphoserine phosphatase RsbU/P
MKDLKNHQENSSLEEENRRLRISIQELSILNEIAAAISSTLSLNNVIELIVKKCIKHLHVEQCSITLLDLKSESSDFHTMVRKADETNYDHVYRLDEQLTGWMILHKKPLTINDSRNEKRLNLSADAYKKIRSLITVPLINKGKLIGLLNVFNKREEGQFETDDERLLSIIAAQSASVIENARLLEEEKKLHAMEEELKLAREIQLNLLPKQIPQIPGYEIAAISIPAKEVGGDYYDFIKMDENKTAFCLGDVTGKGLPAAMLVANLQATLRSQILFDTSCSESLKRSNLLLHQSTDPSKFVTLFLGIIDLKTNVIRYSNAGHDYPIFISSNGEVKRLQTGGLLLGCLPSSEYSEALIDFNDGDLLCMYSDGITEAMNSTKQEFGEENLIGLIKEHHTKTADEISRMILNSIRVHVKEEPQSDDITVMVIKRTK